MGKREDLQRQLEELDASESARMEKVISRAEVKIKAAVDDAAKTIAAASAEIDGQDNAIPEEEIKKRLYEKYDIKDETSSGEPPPDGESESVDAPESDTSRTDSEDAPDSETSDNEEEETGNTRDEKPPSRHWADRPLFKRLG